MAGSNGKDAQYIKTDGVWRFKTAHVFQRLRTDHSQGWAKSALPVDGLRSEFPPDRPATVQYASYPEAFTPQMNVANPARQVLSAASSTHRIRSCRRRAT